MQQVFVSPADDQTRSEWDAFIGWVKGEHGGVVPTLPKAKDGAATIAGLEDEAPSGISHGSYLYPSSMFCNPEIWLRSPRTGEPMDQELYEHWGRFGADNNAVPDATTYTAVVRRNRISDIFRPSAKVAFFLERAVHNSHDSYWFVPGSTITVTTGDGSARVIEPASQAIASTPRENAGPTLKLHYHGKEHPGQTPFTNATEGGIKIPFIATWGGIRGRDLQ